MMKLRRALLLVMPALAFAGQPAGAILCPGSGAKVKVVINNPTTTTGHKVTISGHALEGQATCIGQSDTYSTTVTLTSTGDNEFTIPAGGGLNSGIWVHDIAAEEQSQHQKVPVLFTSDQAKYAEVQWTYYPAVVNVNEIGDGDTGSCPPTCTFREALSWAGVLAGYESAVLVQFNLSPSAMTQTGDLEVGGTSTSPITIDGTGVQGDPWIVGDPLAAAQGSQDTFPRAVDLANKTKIVIQGENVTIKGLSIANSVYSGSPSQTLVESSMANTRIEAVRLDGGAKGACGTCADLNINLVTLTGGLSELVNVEGRAAFSNGVRVQQGGGIKEIRDSWIHHNYGRGVLADGARLTHNTIELSGRQLGTETVRNSYALGIKGDATSEIYTARNVIQNNTAPGVEVPVSPFGLDFVNDFVCGNGYEGIYVDGGVVSSVISGTGLVTAYNSYNGLVFANSVPNDASIGFDNDSAFTANFSCGLLNNSSATVDAENNQWRGATSSCTESSDVCASSGPIDCDPIQDHVNVAVQLDEAPAGQPASPMNAILKGQTVRVQGSGFNAIDGNPEASDADCDLGDSNIGETNCCRKTSKANVCDDNPGGAPLPPDNKSNCVALKGGTGAWTALPVTGVTPTTIVAQIADDPFSCLGESGEQVRVVKQNSVGDPLEDSGTYCTNN